VNLRLFLAIEPSEGVRREAGRAVEHLAGALPTLRARTTAPATMHLTLVFLGAVPEEEVPALERAAAGVARTARPFACTSGGLGAFPSARRPSVLWLGLEHADALRGLQRDLARALGPFSGRDERKRFVAHLTLARVAGLGGAPPDAVADALASFRPARAPWSVDTVVLYRSELGSSGARHTPLARLPLAAPTATGPR
jgi:2'-5' RNA ligase